MELYELVQAVQDLSLSAFTESYVRPFLFEDKERVVAERGIDALGEPVQRVFEVRRRDGGEGPIFIGRAPTADVRLDEPTVSSRHAALRNHGGLWLLQDLHSRNGTKVGSYSAPPGVDVPLDSGSVVVLGESTHLVFLGPATVYTVLRRLATGILAPLERQESEILRTTGEWPTFPRAPTPMEPGASLPPAPRQEGVLSGLWFVVRCEPFPEVPLPPGRDISVGRTDENIIVLPHSAVSRRHAVLRREGDAVLVRDLSSRNGTFLGGRRVPGDAFVGIGGPAVSIGPYELRIETAEAKTLREPGTSPLTREGVRGTLDAMPLTDLLQAVELNGRSGAIRIETPEGKSGEVIFSEGAPLRASFGRERGVVAVVRMLQLRSGTFTYEHTAESARGPREIKETFLKILLDASRLASQAGSTWSTKSGPVLLNPGA